MSGYCEDCGNQQCVCKETGQVKVEVLERAYDELVEKYNNLLDVHRTLDGAYYDYKNNYDKALEALKKHNCPILKGYVSCVACLTLKELGEIE